MKNKPLRIAFDASPLLVNKTGVAYYMERLMTNLAETYPDDVELIGFYYNFLGRRSTKHFPQLPNISYRGSRFIPSKIIYQLRRWNIEIPLEFFYPKKIDFVLFGNFLGYPRLRNTPGATVVHDLTYLDLPEYVSAKNRNDLTRFVPKEIARSAFVITVSEFSKQKIATTYGIDPTNILVTPVPPEPPIFYNQTDKQETLNKAGITKPFILFLSTIEPRKNLINLIEAYQQLSTELREQYTLVIAGRIGWNCEAEEAKIKEVTKQKANITYLGYVDDKTRAVLLQSATLMANASHYEGFGMTVLEAMSYGTPCAISNIAVYHEVAGDSAVYFNQDSPAAIAQSLATILIDSNQLQTMSRRSKARAATFSWKRVANSLFSYIQKSVRK